MQRRGFLSAILGAAAAPAIVSASSLMKIVPVTPLSMTQRGEQMHTWMEAYIQSADGLIALRPTKIITPASLRAECLTILNAAFAKEYTTYARRNR
jgi:hypothetical protein